MKLIQHVWMACIGLCLFSCTQTDELETAQGKTGFIVSLTDGTKLDVSRATPGEIVESKKIEGTDFDLKIVNAETKEIIYNDKVSTGVIEAYSGVYDLTASYGTNPILELDAPYFEGETKGVEVFSGRKPTPVTIACKVANALVSVTYDNSKALFEDVYSNYYVEVKVGEESVEIKDVAQSAYMQAGSAFEVIFHGTPKDANEDKSVVLDTEFGVPATLNAGDHLKLTLSPKLDRFDIPLNIESVAVETAPLTEEIPMEWLPKPKVEAEGFTDNELSFVETEQKDAKLNLTLSSALQDIKFKFNFEDEQERFTSLDKEKEYFLSTDKEFIEQALGITLPAVGEKPESIDLSGLIAKLQTNAGEPTTNTIEIDVQANDRWSSEDAEANRVYTLTCNKPEFSIAVQPGNCWSREFTIDEVTVLGNADAEKIKSQLVYQYYNGTEWVECTTREENGSVKGRTQQFEEAAENIATKTYKVRALYRDAIASAEVDATLETPEQLPNSGFEDWYEEDQDDHKNLWFPYAQGASGPQWTTNNSETTNNRSESFCSTSGVKKTTSIIYSGTAAAWIRTVGHGIWNTNVGGLGSLNGSITGTGTIGILSYSDVFAVRPTQLSFNYRYIQKGDDAGVVELKIENQEQNVVLFETSFTVTNTDYIRQDIPIDYSITNIPATHMTLTFKSGSKHTEVVKAKVRGNNVDGTEADEHYGSEFYVDDISLTYDK